MPRPRIIDPNSVPTRDSFMNLQMSVGVGTNSAGNPLNQISGGTYQFNPITRLRILLDYAYRGNWIVRKGVDVVADDMTRENVDFESTLDPGLHEDLDEMTVALQIWSKLNETIKWARLYGGCLAFMMIDGQDPRTPLDIDRVGKGQFKGLFVLDRWMVQPSLQDPVTDMGPDLGLPKYYFVNTDANGIPMMTIHYSRVIRITGDDLPYYQRQAENMWSCSCLEAVWDRLIAYDSVTMGAAQLVFKAHLRILRMKNYRELVAEGGAVMQEVNQYLSTIRMFQANEGLTVLDFEDEFQVNQYAFSGLPDTMLQFAQQISGAWDIPLIRLFSQSPSGMNATGDVDLRMYYDKCKSLQESKLRPGMTRLYPVMIRSLTGKAVPDGFRYNFTPLWQLTDEQKSTVSKSDTDDVTAVLTAGIISDQTALKELRERGRTTGRWQSITDEDIDAANDEVVPPVDLNQFGAPGAAPGGVGAPGDTDPADQTVNQPGEAPQVKKPAGKDKDKAAAKSEAGAPS